MAPCLHAECLLAFPVHLKQKIKLIKLLKEKLN